MLENGRTKDSRSNDLAALRILTFFPLLHGLAEPVVAGGGGGGTVVAAGGGAVASVVAAGAAFGVGLAFHAEGDALALEIDFGDGDLDFLADLEDFTRIAHELIAELANVDEAVLVDADIDKGTEGGDVGDDAGELHADFEIAGFLDTFGKGK